MFALQLQQQQQQLCLLAKQRVCQVYTKLNRVVLSSVHLQVKSKLLRVADGSFFYSNSETSENREIKRNIHTELLLFSRFDCLSCLKIRLLSSSDVELRCACVRASSSDCEYFIYSFRRTTRRESFVLVQVCVHAPPPPNNNNNNNNDNENDNVDARTS